MLLEASGVGRLANGGGAWLLRDVSLTVGAGERVAVVGPSGAGKTLLLRALALLDPVDEGEVLWRGQAIPDDRVPAYRRKVIYLHQRPALFEGTVEANLRQPFGFVVADGAYDRGVVLGFLETLGRDAGFLAKRTADLSGGEAQITAFVRALQLDPEILLLDEPTAALDGEAADAIERLADRWFATRPGDRALVWVSHDPEQARRVAGRSLRLRDGWLAP